MNRAEKAIIELKKVAPRGLMSCQLAKLIGQRVAFRAVEEARKKGYTITDWFEDCHSCGAHEKRYFYNGEGRHVEPEKPTRDWVLIDTLHDKKLDFLPSEQMVLG